jgi:NADH:ubiquinone oxidoreductase subunit 5 (subunit L)/multisubunit Na+/H+ antiporter MnhA subunit
MGVGVLGTAYGHPVVAMLGFAGAILHTVNHALFKSLLFLGAGAAYAATGTREIDQLGGLARRMPVTWLAFAIGATAIIGVPPLNGFVSEWLVYQGLAGAGQSHELVRLAVFGIPALALIGALALACFAKAGGVVFLGTARSAVAADAREVGGGMLVPMMLLAALCAVLGVVPVAGIALVSRAATTLAAVPDGALPPGVVAGAWGISFVAITVIALSALLWGLRRMALRGRGVRRERTWGGGFSVPAPRAQYTASSFAAPLVSLFGWLSGVRTERSGNSVRTHPTDLVLDGMALPLWRTAQRAALRLRPIQQGRLYWYLLYVMAALLTLLGYLAFGSRR